MTLIVRKEGRGIWLGVRGKEIRNSIFSQKTRAIKRNYDCIRNWIKAGITLRGEPLHMASRHRLGISWRILARRPVRGR